MKKRERERERRSFNGVVAPYVQEVCGCTPRGKRKGGVEE